MTTETKAGNASSQVQVGPELSIIIPTFNESSNVRPLIEHVEKALGDHHWEIIFVDDDSPDNTSASAKQVAMEDIRVRCIRRIGRRGLSSAVAEGILSSASPYVAVMDGDLQHDEKLLPEMLQILERDEADIVVASRYVSGGSAGGLADANRHKKSQIGNWLAQTVLKVDVKDPMSGFFMLPRQVFEDMAEEISAEGFKILLDILASSPTPLRTREIPMSFRERHSGDSKLDFAVEVAFANMLIDKTIGRYIPRRFLLFSVVGGSGVFIHLAMLKASLLLGATFAVSQGIAAITAMTTNFWLNNLITFADKRLRGMALLTGLLSFYLVCSVGLVGNIGVADFLFKQNNVWWLSGLAGALVSAVWNYAASSLLTWRR